MGVLLFEHNQKAYEAAVSMMEEEGKAAVIHPTGTGKSFIAFKLAYDCPEAKICWLAPSEYIFKTQLENLKRVMAKENAKGFSHVAGDMVPNSITEETGDFSNIQFLTYSRLMLNEEDMEEIQPDYIVLDEFHRCGAAEWGKSVRKLLGMYPEARILGLSATNVRYLDNQRDMAQEIFEGNVASEMTLGEAIARGILAAPKYVISLFSYEEELKKLERKVQALENEGLVHHNMQLIEKLRRALEQAEGLPQVFAKHMVLKSGKYLVFCADKEHMDEMKEQAWEWFERIDAEPHIYSAYYNNPETSKAFAAFKADDSEHIKLLYCIDMLNEGVHVEDVDGVILLRPTVSPIIYLQQIGRSLSAGTTKEPIIFDLVNNFESLYCIDCLEQEIEDAFRMMPCAPVERAAFEERFRIIDEVRDCRMLFKQLQSNLSSSWETYYLAAKQYYAEKGDLKIPKSYVTPTGLTLGSWIQTQRKVYKSYKVSGEFQAAEEWPTSGEEQTSGAYRIGGTLTEEKIAKLNAIGMVWNVKGNSWEEVYGELLNYYENHGNIDIKATYVSDSGYALGKWISNLRGNVKKKGMEQVLTPEQQEQLGALGMIWDKRDLAWEKYVAAAESYRREHGNLQVPAKYVTPEGIALGSWLHGIKHGLSGEKSRAENLTAAQKAQLEELGIRWENENVTLWRMKFELAKDYYEQHGNLNIPVAYCVGDVKLGRWISNIRSKRKNPASSGMNLDEGRIKELDSIGMDWR